MVKKVPLMQEKTKLVSLVKDFLQSEQIETQDEICGLLRKKGLEVNQVMVSRLLHKLGAIKMNENGKIVYRLPTEIIHVSPQNALNKLILGIKRNDSLIVVNTAPGSAQLVARLLDQQKDFGILGTVAGDDTVFIAPETIKKIDVLMKKITALLFNENN